MVQDSNVTLDTSLLPLFILVFVGGTALYERLGGI